MAKLIENALVDWSDERAMDILRNTRRAMAGSAALFVIERVLEADRPGLEAALSDLSMMVMNGGRERTRSEFEALLSGAGFNLARATPTPTRFQIIEAKAV